MEVRGDSNGGLRSPYIQQLVLGAISMLVAIYLVKDHMEDKEETFCDFGANISCTTVRRSVFSEFLGVPVALSGFFYHVVLCALAYTGYQRRSSLSSGYFVSSLFYWNCFGTIFVFYLIFAELYLQALCPFCTVLHIAQVLLMYISWKQYNSRRHCPSLLDTVLEMKYWLLFIAILNFIPLILFNTIAIPVSTVGGSAVITDEKFARCITTSGWRFFGREGCSWCQKQKLLFGDTMNMIIFIDCAAEHQKEKCEEWKIDGYPTWIRTDENGVELDRWKGYASTETLVLITGCELEGPEDQL